MRKILVIARREYLHNLRKRTYLFTAFGVPLFMIAVMLLSFVLAEREETATGGLGNIGYVDQAGVIMSGYEMPEEYIAYESLQAAEAAFEADDIGAYLVIPEGYWNDGYIQMYAPESIPEGVENQIEGLLRANVAAVGPDEYTERLRSPMDLVFRTVGGQLEITEESIMGVIMLPTIFGVIFMMASLTTSQFLLQGVASEKENRIMELLVTSVTPEQLLAGKILGLGGLGLTQIFVWGIVGVVAILAAGDSSPFLQALRVPPSFVIILLIYFVLGYLFYGTIMAGLGATVTAEQEGRQVAGFLSFGVALPFFFYVVFIENPNGTAPVILSLIPFTAPTSMLMRLPLAAVPFWQLALSMGLMVVGIVVSIWISGRVFRLGMLMYGKRLRLGEIVRALWSGAMTPAVSEAGKEQKA